MFRSHAFFRLLWSNTTHKNRDNLVKSTGTSWSMNRHNIMGSGPVMTKWVQIPLQDCALLPAILYSKLSMSIVHSLKRTLAVYRRRPQNSKVLIFSLNRCLLNKSFRSSGSYPMFGHMQSHSSSIQVASCLIYHKGFLLKQSQRTWGLTSLKAVHGDLTGHWQVSNGNTVLFLITLQPLQGNFKPTRLVKDYRAEPARDQQPRQ